MCEVVLVPIAGPVSSDAVSHSTPEWFDSINDNMNQVRPADSDGTPVQRISAALREYATDADVISNLHSTEHDTRSRVIRHGDDPSHDLASVFRTERLTELHGEAIMAYDGERPRPHHLRGPLRWMR